MSQSQNTPAELLALEEKQLHYFLTNVRPVGEEKSELYPEPQYFNTAFISVAAQLPSILERIVAKVGGAAAYGQRQQRVLAPATALHLSGLSFIATWGREMWLLEEPGADRDRGEIAPGAPTLSDVETAGVLRFAHEAVSHYRRDGRAYPSDTGSLGAEYRILPPQEVAALAAAAQPVDAGAASQVLGLLAAVRALSFLMEAETREALMMHGPYPVGDGTEQLVIFECSDLHWSMFPRFPLPGKVRWQLPENPFPVANLAIALVLRDVSITTDRFGTLYIDPLGPEQVVAASLMTRGVDAYSDEGLSSLPVSEAQSLRRHCDDIQEYLFLQIAGWSLEQRAAAGVYQEHMLLVRMLAAAGFGRVELEAELDRIYATSAPIFDKYFNRNLARSTDQLPFYRRLGAFAAGTAQGLFTPLTALAVASK